ncbi:MAG: MaoC family dehydratase [Proteobacteria bacterium]|nr:MaoC family dehydratase [Pseudomonadota bacterium]MBK8960189.1 MaoC family dehydratase [Pseudomonadota bacterium]
MTITQFAVPADQRYFEDYTPGAVFEFGATVVSEQELVSFAQAYDPQSFHVDREAAAHSMFGGLIASGWHTASLTMRMLVDHYLSSVASLASPGVDELRWLAPVRPGDVLRVRVTVDDARRSRSRGDRGVVTSSVEVLNQHGVVVMTLKAVNLLLTRSAA